jgi:hypothetical protein
MSKIRNNLLMQHSVYAIVLLCGFTVLFSSCENGNAFSGIVINFSLGDTPLGANENIFRSFNERDMESITVPIDADWYMSATLEPDPAVGTRASASGLDNGTEVRVLAFSDYNAGAIISQADYTVMNGNELVPKSTPLTVPIAGEYTFVAYTSNGQPLSFLDPLNFIDPIVGKVLWGKSSPIQIMADHTKAPITIKHICSKVTMKATAGTGSSNRITSISTHLSGYGINLSSGKPAPVSVATYVFPSTSWTYGNDTVTSEPSLTYTNSESPTSVTLHFLNIAGATVVPPGGSIQLSYNKTLLPNVQYTLRIIFHNTPSGTWAGSNIYWDGSKLTFDAPGITTHEKYQGVLFKFGSLVGISPATWTYSGPDGSMNMWAMADIFLPPGYQGVGWRIDTVSAASSTAHRLHWNKVPYWTAGTGTWRDALVFNATAPDQPANGLGDICRYLGAIGAAPAGFRLPKSVEFGYESNLSTGMNSGLYYAWGDSRILGWASAGGFLSDPGLNDNNGTTPIANADNRAGRYSLFGGVRKDGVFFPASGRRGYSTFYFRFVYGGFRGSYWSGSTYGNGMGYSVDFHYQGLIPEFYQSRNIATPIRCIKN